MARVNKPRMWDLQLWLALGGLTRFGDILTRHDSQQWSASLSVFRWVDDIVFGLAFLFISLELPNLVASRSAIPRRILWGFFYVNCAFGVTMMLTGNSTAIAVSQIVVGTLFILYIVSRIYRLQQDVVVSPTIDA